MNSFTLADVNSIEDGAESREEYYDAIQRAINSGLWSLQGSYGRAMMDAIDAGACVLGRAAVRDFYGNVIPARDQVQEGTKGSVQFVADRFGQAWADRVSAL